MDYSNSIDHLPPRPPSASAILGKPPSIKVRPPTIRSNHGQASSTNSLSAAARSISRSTENLASSPPSATPLRPPSRSGSSTAKKTKPPVSEFKRPRTPVRASRSARTSPVNSREASPVRVVPKGASMPRSRHVPLTTESLRMSFVSLYCTLNSHCMFVYVFFSLHICPLCILTH